MTRKLLLSLLFCCIYKTLSLVNLLSGIIAYPIVSPRAIQQWIINPVNPTASTVQFTFEFMNMRQVELRIYEYVPTNSNGFGDLLYNCVNCGTLLPPSFYSRTGAVTVFVKANSGIGFQESDFRLKYICSPTAITGRLGNLSTKLNAGYGKIRPTRSNNLLPASSYQEWIITQDPGATITFSFATFSLGKASTAVVTIFDSLNNQGNIIFTGRIDNDRPDFWFYSYTGNALVTVTVGSTDSTADFTLSYYTDMNLYACGAFLQPDVLLDNSFILSDGSKSTQLMRRGERCVWRISPINGDTVSLVFQWVSLKFGSSIMVYDGVDNNAVVLWNGNGATETLPPIITSSSKSLYVDYRSDPSNTVRFLGFLGEFTSNYVGSLGSGRGFTTLGMSSELFITPPGKSIEQPSSSNYTWYIKPQFISGPITFAFNQLSLSSFDRVVIYDGPTTGAKVLASFSGLNSRSTPDRWFTTSKSSATVQSFTSAISTPKFSLAYFADGPHYHCGFTRNPAVLMASSMTITDGSSSAETIYRNQYCEWTISPAESSAVVMFFSRFGVLGGSLKIYIGSVADGTLFSEISNTLSVPAPLFLPYSTIGISFTTSGALVDGLGFSLTYYGVKSSRSFSGNDLMYFYSSSLLSWKLGTSLLNARKLESLSHGVKEYATNDLSVLEGNTQHDLALSDITISPGTNHTWILSLASIGGIYFAFTRINFDSDCTNTYLDIYDGTTTYAPLLKRFCGKSLNLPYQWLKTTKNSAILNFVTKEIVDTVGNFELSYYSDGDNNHCGFHVNPAILTAPSMIFTDGSSSSILMFSNEACTWHIIPNLLQVSSTVTKSFTIVLEFLECDMRGGQVAVYDGTSSNSNLLWQCIDCSSIPRTIISSTGRMRVDYFSRSVRGPGTGFRAVYWTIVDNVWRSNSIGVEPQIMLELPLNFAMNADTNNQSSAIRLAVSTSSAILSFFPKYKSINNMLRSEAVDGRIDNMFESHATPINTCGIIQNKGKNFIFNEEIYSLPTQDTKTYLHSTASEKQLLYVQGIYDHTDFNSADTRFHAVDTCKYMLDGGSNQAIIFTINSLLTTVNGRLRIFGGVFGNDAVIYDSNKAPVLTTGTLQGVTIVVAPCGKALIVLESFATNDSTGSVDYSMNLNYKVMDGDTGAVCDAYGKFH